ncbi:MAG: hypothetical protein RIB60_10860 [Phycisphaerales bacterium]
MKAKSALTLALAAGVCSTATAETTVPAIGVQQAKSAGLVGHYYINVATGETVFTPAKEYLANKASQTLRAIGDDINGDGTPDVWINTNGDPCPVGTTASPNTNIAAVDTETTQGDTHLYKAQGTGGSTDLLVETLTFSYWNDIVDTDTNGDSIADGNTRGAGFALTFWDKEDFFGKTSSFCPTAGGPGFTRTPIVTLSATNMPGPLTAPAPGYLAGFVLTFDLTSGTSPTTFEIGDTDGVSTAAFFNPMVAAVDTDTNTDTVPDVRSADTDGNGTIDWGYSIQAIQPTAPQAGEGLIGYQIAAPGREGAMGEFATDGVTPLNAQAGVAGDGLHDYIKRALAPGGGTTFDATRITFASQEAPMGASFPFLSSAVGTAPEQLSLISRFSLFFGSLGETADPAGSPPVSPFSCAGLSNSDFFGWGETGSTDATAFSGSFNCGYDIDNDTVEEVSPWSGMYLALSGAAGGGCSFADCDANGTINIDDIDCFVAAFLAGDLAGADCDGNNTINIDDIDCFVASFLAGCP